MNLYIQWEWSILLSICFNVCRNIYVIILNKLDLISKDQLKTVKALIKGLNVKAKIIEATNSKVEMKEVMDTGLYNLEEAQNHPLWLQELYNPGEHVPETEEYGITSFVYRAREQFDAAKIYL